MVFLFAVCIAVNADVPKFKALNNFLKVILFFYVVSCSLRQQIPTICRALGSLNTAAGHRIARHSSKLDVTAQPKKLITAHSHHDSKNSESIKNENSTFFSTFFCYRFSFKLLR